MKEQSLQDLFLFSKKQQKFLLLQCKTLFSNYSSFAFKTVIASFILISLSTQFIKAQTFNNPVHGGADPSCILYNGSYYYVESDGANNIYVSKSSSITKKGSNVGVFYTGQGVCWAPEIWMLNGKIYIYYSNFSQIQCLEANTSDPQGSYTYKGVVLDNNCIDASILKNENGSLSLLAAVNENGIGRCIYIYPMDNPYHVSGSGVKLSQPEYSWETSSNAVNEGPEAIVRNGKAFIVYAANNYGDDSYCLGMLTNTDGNLYNKSSWSKSSNPVLKSNGNGISGPGHCFFTKSKDLTEDWIMFTCWYQGNRSIACQKYTFDANGNPYFGEPIAHGVAIPLPSGDNGSGTAPPPPASSYFINSGGGATGTFAADNYVSGGNTYIGTSTIDVSGVANAAPSAVYQSERWGASTYTFPSLVAGKSYTVRLHFAEIYFDAAGKRKFNVDINETRQLTDFDVFAAAGAKNKAVVKDFTITPDANNNIVIAFTNGALDNAKINGIEVFPAGSVTPPPSGIVSGSTYEITARHSGKAIDVNGGPTATQDGANVQQWTYGGGTNQQWKVEDVGGGYYKLTAKHSGKVLDVSGSGTADGTNVQQWTSNGTDAQKWSITDIGGGYYKVISKVSGKALDVTGGQSATGDGVNVQQWTYGGGTNQQWAFTLISSARMAFEAAEPTANSLNVYPNPSKGIANISYTPLKTEQIGIHLYDTQGKLIRTIFNGSVPKGVAQSYSIDGSVLKEGLYIIRLKTPSNTITKKVIFNK